MESVALVSRVFIFETLSNTSGDFLASAFRGRKLCRVFLHNGVRVSTQALSGCQTALMEPLHKVPHEDDAHTIPMLVHVRDLSNDDLIVGRAVLEVRRQESLQELLKSPQARERWQNDYARETQNTTGEESQIVCHKTHWVNTVRVAPVYLLGPRIFYDQRFEVGVNGLVETSQSARFDWMFGNNRLD